MTSPCSKYHFNNGVESPIFLPKYDQFKRRRGTSLMFCCLAYSCMNSPTSSKQTSTFFNIGVISEKYSLGDLELQYRIQEIQPNDHLEYI